MIKLSSTGEVGDFRDVDQFQPAKTQFACGFFSGAIIRVMAPVGSQPAQSVAAMIAEAETWYAAADGSNAANNMDGMSLQAEYDMVTQKMGMHYQAIALDVPTIRAWVKAGYPILLTIAETSVLDMALGSNPYPWNPAGSHIIVVSGIAGDGNFLVRDPANCTNLYDPNSLRPGPRKYEANKLQIWTATVVVPKWMPRPTSTTPPTGGSNMPTPTGWKDDGKTLTAPNGVPVVLGFRDEITNAPEWDAADVPLIPQFHTSQVQLHNTNLGEGDVLFTKNHVLWYTLAKGVVNEPQLGSEIKSCYDLIAAQQAQIAALKAAQPTSAGTPVDTTQAIADVHAIADDVAAALATGVAKAIVTIGKLA